MSTRKLQDLMKTQDVSTSSPLNRALKLNQQLEGMREKNVNLYDQNQELTAKNKDLTREREGLVQLVKDLNKELDELKTNSMATEKRLYGELKNMQASWDSLYEEHRAAEERRERELRKKNTADNGENATIEEDKCNRQADLLRSAVKKQSVPSDMVSPMEQKLHEMEAENKKLKSKVVQLQTKYREEKYKNENGLKESDSTSVTDSDSVGSTEQNPPAGANLFSQFSKRNSLDSRPSLLNGPRGPRITQSTRSLWGRMTSNRSLNLRPQHSFDVTRKPQNSFDVSNINLAFTTEE